MVIFNSYVKLPEGKFKLPAPFVNLDQNQAYSFHYSKTDFKT